MLLETKRRASRGKAAARARATDGSESCASAANACSSAPRARRSASSSGVPGAGSRRWTRLASSAHARTGSPQIASEAE